ncbi:MAG: peptidoglycan recognition family protein [Planctomycetota bacterium]
MHPIHQLLLATALLLLFATPTLAQDPTTQPPTPLDTLNILTREQWQAKPPAFDMIPQTVDAITIHHTAMPQRPDRDPGQALRNLQAFSQREDTLANGKHKKAWADVPYHFYIHPTGTIVEARDLNYQGDTNTNYDLQGQAQIVLEGNFEEIDPTPEQLQSLTQLVAALQQQYDIPTTRIATHGERAPNQTLCPGKSLQAFVNQLRDQQNQ